MSKVSQNVLLGRKQHENQSFYQFRNLVYQESSYKQENFLVLPNPPMSNYFMLTVSFSFHLSEAFNSTFQTSYLTGQ